MLPISNCSQFYPYAGKTSPCDGQVHELTIEYIDKRMNPTNVQVCDAHLNSFNELRRRKTFEVEIINDKIIGVISHFSSEGQKPSKEQK